MLQADALQRNQEGWGGQGLSRLVLFGERLPTIFVGSFRRFDDGDAFHFHYGFCRRLMVRWIGACLHHFARSAFEPLVHAVHLRDAAVKHPMHGGFWIAAEMRLGLASAARKSIVCREISKRDAFPFAL